MSDSPHPVAAASLKHRIIFAVITALSFWLISSSVMTYLIQDSSPKQTVALLQTVLFLIGIIFVYFCFYKFNKFKFEDTGSLFFSFDQMDGVIIWFLVVAVIVGLSIYYYQQYQAIEYNSAYNSLMDTLNKYKTGY